MGKIIVAGIGPGSKEDITPAVQEALREADAIVGYKYYFQFVEEYLREGCECVDTGMKKERDRAEQAFLLAKQGKTVVVISSGDAGIYGMTPLIYEMAGVVGNASERCDVGTDVVGNASERCSADTDVVGNASGRCSADTDVVGNASGRCSAETDVVGNASGRCSADTDVVGNASERCSAETDVVGNASERCSAGIEIVTLPGISAFQKAASLLGAPIGHDMCIISLSDLMTPWEVIERRIKAAAVGDFVTAIYNPKSHGRYWQLYRLQELFLKQRSAETPVGIVRQAGREEQKVTVTTLGTMPIEEVDMFCVIIIGNSQSYIADGKIITPRGYYRETGETDVKPGQQIMMESFRTIEKELRRKDWPLGHKWALLHAIHTTADFDMEKILYTDEGAVETLYNKVREGTLKTIVTDVTMVTSGIRKGALQRLGIEAKCYLSNPRVASPPAPLRLERGVVRSSEEGCNGMLPLAMYTLPSPIGEGSGVRLDGSSLTRTQAGIRLAVEEHPDALFVFGNAPTALMELCDLIRKGKARPVGIIAAPVGFVHVRESKHMVKPFKDIPKIIVEGRKGGSNLAATLCNAILTFDDAAQLKPGRDL